MSITRTSAALALSVAVSAMALATPAMAQDVSRVQPGATVVETLPPAPTPVLDGPVLTGPALTTPTFSEERTIGPDGVETIVRTRVIRGAAPIATGVQPVIGAYPYPAAYSAPVVEREQWLSECNRRIDGRSKKERAQIIGGLLGAIGGGILGNVLSDGNRLGGTLLGAGAGGLAGVGVGSLVSGGDRGDRYDCEAALDGYVSYYGQYGAARSIPYPYAPAGYQYAYTGQYGYSSACGCEQPQMTLIPIRTEVRQRVIVREQTREILVPGERVIEPPRPPLPPLPIKPSGPTKLIKQ